jgi:hypothetical protein
MKPSPPACPANPDRPEGQRAVSISNSYLTSLFGASSAGTSGSLLQTLYGIGSQPTNLSGQNPVEALESAEQNQTQDIKATAAQPTVQHAIAAFTAGVQKATSVTQLLNNPAVMQVLLTANGLADQLPYTALAQKALTSDLTNPSSLANTLSDTRWKTVAQTYNFATKGLSVIQNPATISTLANAYAEVTWRQSLDAQTPGLSNALTFRAEASKITSVDQILGDSVMRNVVTTALGLPLEIAFQPLEAQEKAITSRLDITQFQKPAFVESFVQKFLVANNSSTNPNATTTATPTISSLAIQLQGLVV